MSYAAITARHFNAKYSCICRSGIGITISWSPLIMPEMYDRLNPTDSKSKWDFTKYTPDIVVVNLMQNDSWLVNNKNYDQFKARFGEKAPTDSFIIEAYQNFIRKIRKEYPKATIICALGAMDATKENSVWMSYIDKAVQNLNDSKIYSYFFPFKKTKGHPNKQEQEEMAKQLIDFIKNNTDW